MSSSLLFRKSTPKSGFICRACSHKLRLNQLPRWFHETSAQAARVRPRTALLAKKHPGRPASLPRTAVATAPEADPFAELDDDDGSVEFFEEDPESGEVKKLDGEAAYEKSVVEAGLVTDIKGDLERLVDHLRAADGGESSKSLEFDKLIAEVAGRIGNTKDPRLIHRKLGGIVEELGRRIDAAHDPLGFLSDEDLKKSNLEPRDVRLEMEARALRRSATPQIPTEKWTNSQRRRIATLNAILERMAKQFRRAEIPTSKNIRMAWMSYTRARQFLGLSWNSIPPEVWQLLWKIFSTETMKEDPNRLARIAVLAKDMSAAKIALKPAQQLLAMEAMFVDGWEKNAMDSWKRSMSTLGDEAADTFAEYWELGVRMWCKLQKPDEAWRAIEKLLSAKGDPRIIVPYIRTCAELRTEDGKDRSWEAYRRMRELLGEDMTIEDYDTVIAFFLTSSHTDSALYAFVDMMTSGSIDLRGKGHLPSVIANKFFFGKWLKRLIGAGDLKGAYRVLEFMRSRGIEASPIQVNGLIAALYRSGGGNDLKLADEVAWDMIRARLEFVSLRNRFSSNTGVPVAIAESGARSSSGAFARATLETFCLVAENYRVRRLPDRMRDLWDAFSGAEIEPDAFMMNQLMESYSDEGNINMAQQLYQRFVYERQITPDSHTFMALFKLLGGRRLEMFPVERLGEETQSAREQFAEMIRFREVVVAGVEPGGATGDSEAEAEAEAEGFDDNGGALIDGQLARKVLHTFRQLRDGVGLVVALRALRAVFNFTPPEPLALEMVVGTTSLDFEDARSRQRIRVAGRRLERDVVNRLKGAGRRDVKALEDLTLEERGAELCEYLQRFFLPEAEDVGGDERLAELLEEAASQMGVYDILLEDAGGR